MEVSTTPFLKWPGGKRWLVAGRPELFNIREERYIEPFLGSGAVYFHVRPARAILSDLNADLVNVYAAVREDWASVSEALSAHAKKHSTAHYYEVRGGRTKLAMADEAARLIYLNRTCWNGLYRVNRQGFFNVPIGTKDSVILENDNFSAISNLLKQAEICQCDFEESIDQALEGDFIFADPPYTVRHNFNGFIKYNEKLFSWDDQVRLRDALVRADLRGARILMTNADHESIRSLYDGIFRQESISRNSVLAGKGGNRGVVTELLIRNW
jgi:DNA adenine methylase